MSLTMIHPNRFTAVPFLRFVSNNTHDNPPCGIPLNRGNCHKRGVLFRLKPIKREVDKGKFPTHV